MCSRAVARFAKPTESSRCEATITLVYLHSAFLVFVEKSQVAANTRLRASVIRKTTAAFFTSQLLLVSVRLHYQGCTKRRVSGYILSQNVRPHSSSQWNAF